MEKFDFVELDELNPVKLLNFVEAEKYFGKYYKYDLPKYCSERGINCYYVPPVKGFILLWDGCEKV